MARRAFHVSSARNRDSIRRHGLDWSRMGAARGIAGAERPEIDGVFVCRDEYDVDFFVRMNNTGGPVDVWLIDESDETDADFLESSNGFAYVAAVIPPERLTLIEPDAVRERRA